MIRNKALRVLGWIALALAPACSWALNGGEGLAGTLHDFIGQAPASAGGGGLCTYCHTPQRTSGSPVLWNHALSSNHFRWDAAETSAGTRLRGFSGSTYKGTSARCLSCHDGSVAVGDVSLFDGQGSAGSSLVAPARISDPTFLVGAGGNLSGNHPVAVPYPMGKIPNHYNGATNGSGRSFDADAWQSNPTSSPVANIRLYEDDGAGNMTVVAAGSMTASAGIECSSCHDPHNKASVDDMFLRGKKTGRSQSDGYLCQQCHNM